MTIISKYAYKAVWDATELSKGLMNSRALFQAQKKIVEDSRTPFDRLAIGQENLNKLIEKYPELASQKLRLEKQLEKQYLLEESAVRKLDAAERQRLNTLLTVAEKQERAAARMEKARARVQQRYSTFDESGGAGLDGPNWGGKDEESGGGMSLGGLGKAGLAAGAAVGAYKLSTALKDIATQGIAANKEVERAEITFEHFSGSADVSAKMMDRLRTMSSDAGVSFNALSDGAARFMVQGFSGNDAIKTMSQIAEVTGGIPERMDRLSIAFAQVKSKGQLFAEEMQQMNESGFSPLIELAQVLGVEVSQVNDQIEKGNVTWEVFAKAIDKATSAGGRFDGFLDKFKGTSLGAANESAAAWENAYARIGKAMEPVTSMWAKFSTRIAKDLADSADALSGASGAPVVEDKAAMQERKKQEARAKERARIDETRKREQAAFAEIEARNAEQAGVAGSGLQDQQFGLIKSLASDDELAKFEKMYSLLSDFNKEQAKLGAIENFKSGLGLGDLSGYLGAEAKAELKKTEQLEKQLELRQKQQEVIDRSKQIAEKFASDEQKQVDALADLEMARRFGGLSQADFDRESKKVVATESKGGGLATSMQAGSAKAYEFMAGVQDRGQREKVQEKQENKQLQLRMIKAIEKVEAAVKESEMAAAG